jgi:hypothetical protein
VRDTFFGIGGTSRRSDHPTITYVPLTGDKFAKGLMSPIPIPIPAILSLVQSGYPADVVLRFCANAVNGLENARGGLGPRHSDPGFVELLALMRAIPRSPC